MIGFSSVLLFMTLFYYSVVNTGQVFFILTILFLQPSAKSGDKSNYRHSDDRSGRCYRNTLD